MNWQPIGTAPKDGTEFLTYNMRQGGMLQLVSWNRVHKHWRSKGKYVYMQATHWLAIPTKPPKEQETK